MNAPRVRIPEGGGHDVVCTHKCQHGWKEVEGHIEARMEEVHDGLVRGVILHLPCSVQCEVACVASQCHADGLHNGEATSKDEQLRDQHEDGL